MESLIHIYPQHPFWVWAAVAAALLAIEVMTGSGYLLWPAAAAAVVALLTGLRLGAPVEVLIFAALTIVTTLAARRFLPSPLRPKGPDINDPHNRIVGRQGLAASAFMGGHGRVFVDGKEWAAELEEGGELAVGAHVRVTGVLSGASLKVRQA
jgi:hypothetical protein